MWRWSRRKENNKIVEEEESKKNEKERGELNIVCSAKKELVGLCPH